jgi:hypothetical protein
VNEPFYIRAADYRYCLRSNPAYGWATGVTPDGLQVLHSGCHWLIFDRDGALLRASDEAVEYQDAPIEVLRFWVPDRWLGIEDLPDTLAEFYTAPDKYEMEPGDPELWLQAGQFMFYPGGGSYIMGPWARVEAS